ncbi:hypothetical protein [Paucilactobacillus kaifaensis]|uniref:hypothetical protein n=1 Tax=Paucilactobacillus kaifaensis TaxID=2559921 RepID=UPI0010F603CD|nr:hypothetical protein [Paucilactobacillus kaifaensis]
MLDVKNSLERLNWNTEHHYEHIAAKHDFIRAWAIQFELGYTDFRVIQMALQLADEHELLTRFTTTYDKVYDYEYEFATQGLNGFLDKFGDQIDDYRHQKDQLLALIKEVQGLQ